MNFFEKKKKKKERETWLCCLVVGCRVVLLQGKECVERERAFNEMKLQLLKMASV